MLTLPLMLLLLLPLLLLLCRWLKWGMMTAGPRLAAQ
jgi:hypothetical protein